MFLLGMVTGIPESVLMVVRMGSMRSTTPTTTAGSKIDPLSSNQPHAAGLGARGLWASSRQAAAHRVLRAGLKA